MTDWTNTTTATTGEPIKWEDMKRIMDRFSPLRIKPADRCVRLELHPATYEVLIRKVDIVKNDPRPFTSLYGLDLSQRFDLPWGSSLHHMADGSSVMHYQNGRAVRCLSE